MDKPFNKYSRLLEKKSMQVIYATGEPRYLDFAITNNRSAVPSNAILLAICTAEKTMENLDEDLFNALTDEEYYTFRALVFEAEQLVKRGAA